MSTQAQVRPLDLNALSVSLQAAVVPMFWGAIALAFFLPVAAASGAFVAKKITKAK